MLAFFCHRLNFLEAQNRSQEFGLKFLIYYRLETGHTPGGPRAIRGSLDDAIKALHLIFRQEDLHFKNQLLVHLTEV